MAQLLNKLSPGERHRTAAVAFGILILISLAYSGAGDLGFIEVYDDWAYVTENPVVRDGLSVAGVRWAFTNTAQTSNWHPLTWLSHMLDVQLFGLAPRGHHLMSLAIHALNAVALLLVLRSLTGSLWRSAVVAALFAVHPLHVQSVAWVSERKDVLCAFFWMATLCAYVSYTRRPGRLRWSLVVVAFVLGLMAKPMLVTLPFVLLLLDYWPLGRVRRGWAPNTRTLGAAVVEKTPLFLLAAGSSALTLFAQQHVVSAADSLGASARVANALLAYVGYLGKTIWPAGLAIFYPLVVRIDVAHVVSAGFVLSLLTFAALAGRRWPALAVGWFWYLGTLVPVIGLVQVGGQAMADRYTYIPLVGVFIAVVWVVSDLGSRTRRGRLALAGGTTLIIGALLFATATEVGRWKDSPTLFRRALEVTTGNWVAERSFGVALLNRGRIEEALPHLEASARIAPGSVESAFNLGVGYFRFGNKAAAAEAFRKTIRLDPTHANAYYNLGVCAGEAGDLAAAVTHFRDAIRLNQGHFEARFNLGLALEKRGAPAEALEQYREALRINPADRDAQAAVQRLRGSR